MVPDEHAAFLVHCSVLDHLTGPVCDAVLQREGSTILLDELERSNLFVIALDRTRTSYRFHHLFRDLLRAELRRREPEIEEALHRRTSEWSQQHGDYDAAVAHARAAGDIDRVEALIWSVLPVYVSTNRTATVVRWLEPFDVHETAARAPLALASAWAAFTSENTADVERWATILDRHRGDGLLPDGTPLRAAIALLQALVGKHGLHQVREDAALAYELHPEGSVWRPLACLLGGTAARLLGDVEAARSMLRKAGISDGSCPRASRTATRNSRCWPVPRAQWDEAERLVDVALDGIDEFGLAERPVTSRGLRDRVVGEGTRGKIRRQGSREARCVASHDAQGRDAVRCHRGSHPARPHDDAGRRRGSRVAHCCRRPSTSCRDSPTRAASRSSSPRRRPDSRRPSCHSESARLRSRRRSCGSCGTCRRISALRRSPTRSSSRATRSRRTRSLCTASSA